MSSHFVVKVKFQDDVRRLTFTQPSFGELVQRVEALFGFSPLAVRYRDPIDGDLVTLSTDQEFSDAVLLAGSIRQNDTIPVTIRFEITGPNTIPQVPLSAASSVPLTALSAPSAPSAPSSTHSSIPPASPHPVNTTAAESAPAPPPPQPQATQASEQPPSSNNSHGSKATPEAGFQAPPFGDFAQLIGQFGQLFGGSPDATAQFESAAKNFAENPFVADIINQAPSIAEQIVQQIATGLAEGEQQPASTGSAASQQSTEQSAKATGKAPDTTRPCGDSPCGVSGEVKSLADFLSSVGLDGAADRVRKECGGAAGEGACGQSREEEDSGIERDDQGRPIWRLVQCDGCGAHPMVGIRYKCAHCFNYDLCESCEAAGDKHDQSHPLIKMRQPSPNDFIGRPGGRGRGKWRRFARGGRGCFYTRPAGQGWGRRNNSNAQGRNNNNNNSDDSKAKQVNSKARFVKDVAIFDGTEVQAGTPFTKIWRFRNDGDDAWLPGTKLAFVGGDPMGNTGNIDVPEVQPGDEINVAANFVAPSLPGRYTSYWRLLNPQPHGSRFGHRVWADILVVPESEAERPPSDYEVVDNAPLSDDGASSSRTADQMAVDDNAQETTTPPRSADEIEYSQHLATLREMGFTNDFENLRLLRHHEGNIPRVVQDIMKV